MSWPTISGVCGAGLSNCTSLSYSVLWSLVLATDWNNFRRSDKSRASWSIADDAYCMVVTSNGLSQPVVSVCCWFCMNEKYGRRTSSTCFGNIGGNVNSVWQLLSRITRTDCWLSRLVLAKIIFWSRIGQSSGLGTEEYISKINLLKFNERKKSIEIFGRNQSKKLPIICSLKYVLMAACALASSSGSTTDTNCVSCASTLAGLSDDTSSMVHSKSSWVEHIWGVAGRWNSDGLIELLNCLFVLN